MKYLAVTTCNGDQWKTYGSRMVDSFLEYWDKSVELLLYAEGWGSNDLYEAAPWLADWKKKYRDVRYQGGRDRRDYRHDAVRFVHKIAAIGAAAECSSRCDVLVWVDADTVTHAPVTEDWLIELFPEPAEIAWLDRDRTYPECGFVMFRLPQTSELIRTLVKAYRNGAVFLLPEWHDSYVIQHYVKLLKIKTQSLSGPVGRSHTGHPFASSLLSSRMDHLKGEIRKQLGRTPKSERRIKDGTEYWQ